MHEQGSPDPGRYGIEYTICSEMGWSWTDLQNAPADFVAEIAERLHLRNHWQQQRRKLEESKANSNVKH